MSPAREVEHPRPPFSTSSHSPTGETSAEARLSFWDYAILLTPFMSGLYSSTPVGNLYLQYGFLALYLVRQVLLRGRVDAPKTFIYVIGIATVLSMIGNVAFSVSADYLVSYLPPILLSFLSYYTYMNESGFNLERLLGKYHHVAFLVSCFAMLQQILHLLGSDAPLFMAQILKSSGPFIGVVGLSSEPSNFAGALAPAVYLSLYRLTIERKGKAKSLIILVALLMSFSALGYLVIFLSLMILLPSALSRRSLALVLSSPLVLVLVFTVANQEHFATRLRDTSAVAVGQASLEPGEVNLSTYSLVVNLSIVRQALPENSFLGVGMGAYPVVFDEHIGDFETPVWRDSLPGRGTATSLLLKVAAELGIVGVVFALWFLVGNVDLRQRSYVNHAFFVALAVVYLRLGFYYINGVPFFALMYWYSKRMSGSDGEQNGPLRNSGSQRTS